AQSQEPACLCLAHGGPRARRCSAPRRDTLRDTKWMYSGASWRRLLPLDSRSIRKQTTNYRRGRAAASNLVGVVAGRVAPGGFCQRGDRRARSWPWAILPLLPRNRRGQELFCACSERSSSPTAVGATILPTGLRNHGVPGVVGE